MKKWLAVVLVLVMVLGVGGSAGAEDGSGNSVTTTDRENQEFELYSMGVFVYGIPNGWVWNDGSSGNTLQRWHYADSIGDIGGGYVYAMVDALNISYYSWQVTPYAVLRDFYEGLTGGTDGYDDCERIKISDCHALVGPYSISVFGVNIASQFAAVLYKNEVFAILYSDQGASDEARMDRMKGLIDSIVVRKPDETLILPDR